jgi:YggT family protein
MNDNQDSNIAAVDIREETVITQQPGYAATQQVSRDVAAERRMGMFRINHIIYSVLGLLQIFLGLRFFLKFIGANPESGFSVFVYGVTAPFIAPFASLFETPVFGDMIFEMTTLIAMAVYALLFWMIVQVVRIFADRPVARSVTRTTQEQIPSTGTARRSNTIRRK